MLSREEATRGEGDDSRYQQVKLARLTSGQLNTLENLVAVKFYQDSILREEVAILMMDVVSMTQVIDFEDPSIWSSQRRASEGLP